jgi:LysR family glycine cleavage system transcriptional activator
MAQRLPPLATLRPFEAAARLESFSKAADELHLTHGAVSHQVRALEEHLGTALFHRHGKRVTLTQAGRAFAERIRAALGEIALAADVARAGRPGNSLTISVLPSFASRWLMPRLIRFMEGNPDIQVNVLANNAMANFAADGVDIGIRFGVGPWPPLACEKMLEDECLPVASPKFNRGRLPKTAKELLGMRIIREDRDYWMEWFEAAGVKLEAPLGGPSYSDASYSLQSAVRGEGVALTRRSLVGDDIEQGRLVQLFPLTVKLKESYWIVCPKEYAESRKVKAFSAWMKSELVPPPKKKGRPEAALP